MKIALMTLTLTLTTLLLLRLAAVLEYAYKLIATLYPKKFSSLSLLSFRFTLSLVFYVTLFFINQNGEE